MKVLIVDDNVAVQEIIKDILAEEGHTTQVASSVDEAVQKAEDFSPDIIVLDTWVGDADGIRVVNRYHEDHPDSPLNVILVKSSNEQVPKDNPFIKGFIDKPFKSADVLEAIDSVYRQMLANDECSAPKKKRRPSLGLFRKKKERIEMTTDMLEDEGLEFGDSYVIFESEPEGIYAFMGLLNPDAYGILVVSSDKAKAIKERFGSVDMEIITLVPGQKSDTFDIHGLGTLMSKINSFIRSKERPVVIFDNLSDIVEANGLSSTLVMMHQLVTGPCERAVTYAASVDPALLTDKDREILLHDMRQYSFSK